MFSKKLMASTIALTAVVGTAFGAASLRTGDITSRAGSLRVNPASATVKTDTTGPATASTTSASTRLATMPGLTNISTKPKLPSAASAATVADLKDKLSGLEADVDALRNAGVDEGAVREIIDTELGNKGYATKDYVDTADSEKLDKSITFSKNDTHIIMTDGKGVTTDVALISDLRGEKGDKGDDGSVDAAELERVVNEKIVEKDLPSKEFLSNKYVTQETYTADQENLTGKITAAQSTADSKLDKTTADTYYADKDYSYSKAEVDTKVANAASGFDEERVTELIGTAVENAGFAKESDLTALDERVGANETNITGLQSAKADKSELADYAKKTDVLSNDGTFSVSDGKVVYTDSETGVVKDVVSLDEITGQSAYETWLDAGNSGTVQDFLASLKGQDGEPGAKGENGATPCAGGLSLVMDETYSSSDGAVRYNLVCED